MDGTKVFGFYVGVAADEGLSVIATLRVPFRGHDGPELPDIRRVGVLKSQKVAANTWRAGVLERFGVGTDAPLRIDRLIAGAQAVAPADLAPACSAFGDAMAGLTFAGPQSVMAAATSHRHTWPREDRLWRVSLRCMFQRLRTVCYADHAAGVLVLPAGLPEYSAEFDECRTKLNAGSDRGGWPKGAHGTRSVRNYAMGMFADEAAVFDLDRSVWLQAADMIAHAVLAKRQAELGWLPGALKPFAFGQVFDRLPADVRNTKASRREPQDGIVRNG